MSLVFNRDLTIARDAGGEDVVFTPAEAKVIRCLAARPGRVTSRAAILDALDGTGSERTDRSVDILITRIRRKLRDNTADPTYIATRYGEGYVWIAPQPIVGEDDRLTGAAIVVGPVRGIADLGPFASRANDFVEGFCTALAGISGLPVETVSEESDIGQPYSVQVSFLRNGGAVDCVLCARTGSRGKVFDLQRITLSDATDYDALATEIVDQAWSELVSQGASVTALQVAMHEAALAPAGDRKSWHHNEARLSGLIKETPDDPLVRLMYAAHLHAKYVLIGWDVSAKDDGTRAADMATIETHVLAALDFAQSRPELAVLSAKLLYFVERGYDNLAAELAESSLAASTAITATYATAAQLRAFRGDMKGAFELFDTALNLEGDRGEQRAWLLSLVCQAALAAGDTARMKASRSELLRRNPSAVALDVIVTDPDRPSLIAKGAVLAMSRRRAEAFLKNWWFIAGRLFQKAEHRERIMGAPIALLTRRFGEGVLPDELRVTK